MLVQRGFPGHSAGLFFGQSDCFVAYVGGSGDALHIDLVRWCFRVVPAKQQREAANRDVQADDRRKVTQIRRLSHLKAVSGERQSARSGHTDCGDFFLDMAGPSQQYRSRTLKVIFAVFRLATTTLGSVLG